MKKVFISYSFTQKEQFEKFHRRLKDYLEKKGFSVYGFVFDFKEKADDKTLMKKALEKVEQADYLIVELSNKSVGVGIEAGYAKAKGKTIIYLHKKGTGLKQTMKGIADYYIDYESIDEIIRKLDEVKIF